MAGYSTTPLLNKLGIREGFKVGLINPPHNISLILGDLPSETKIFSRLTKAMDVVLLFVENENSLRKLFPPVTNKIVSNGMIWVAWPKKSSKKITDLSFDVVQRTGLDAGLVDVKICAIDDVWSGLKFVYRIKDRKGKR